MGASLRNASSKGLFAALGLLCFHPGIQMAQAQTYSTEELFSTDTQESEGFSRRHFDLGAPELSFSTLVADDMQVRIGGKNEDEAVVARVIAPKNPSAFAIEIHRLEFPSFAQAISAGHGYLARMGFDRILRDETRSNHAFALLSAARVEANGEYGEMARAAVVSRGDTVLIALARFDYADYPAFKPALSRFFGALRMDADVALDTAFKTVSTPGGAALLVPAEWQVEKTGKAADAGAADYALSLPKNEYPNVQCQIRPGSIELGRELAVAAADDFTTSIRSSPNARLDGEPELKTYNDPSGKTIGYSFAQPWTATEYDLPMITQFNVQMNKDDSLGFCGLNAFDGQRSAGQDPETADIIYRNWVVGISAFAAARLSLRDGTDAVRNDLDVRRLGH